MRRAAWISVAALSAAAALGGASFAEPAPIGASFKGPKHLSIGPKGTSGATRVQTVEYTGFGALPMIDISTKADGAAIRNVFIDEALGKLHFTLEYGEATPAAFTITIFGHLGKVPRDSGPRRHDESNPEAEMEIEVRRT